jgi:hypothetical protein
VWWEYLAGPAGTGKGRSGSPPRARWSGSRPPPGGWRRSWATANAGVLVGAAGALVALGLALLVVSLIAQGGMAEAMVELASGRPASLGRAWRTGRRLFWRYVGLYLLLVAAVIVVAAVANTFFWNYWTLAYLRLRGPAAEPSAA